MTIEQELESAQNQISALQKRIDFYETNGPARLYYAINRKASEMAELLNSKNLTTIAIDDPKDKTFERLKVIWADSASISEALKSLAVSAGMITGVEQADVSKKPYVQKITPESIASEIGDNKPSEI